MSARTAARLAWTVTVLAILLLLVADLFIHFGPGSGLPTAVWPPLYDVLLPLLVLAFAGIGSLVIVREPSNWVGWICLATGLGASLFAWLIVYSLAAAILNPPTRLPGGLWTTWAVQWVWLIIDGFVFVFLPLLFPTGRPFSRAWGRVIWLCLLALLVDAAAAVVYPTMGLGTAGPSCVWSAAIPGPCYHLANPFPITLPRSVLDPVVSIGGYLESVAVVLAVLSLLARFRSGSSEVRAQLKWLVSAFVVLGLTVVALFIAGNVLRVTTPLLWILGAAAVLAVPVAIGFAILKYHLYDIDLVINKSLVYGALAAFITIVYVAIVVGLGAVIGTQGQPNLALSIVATAVVAVAFQPVRERLQRFANRVVFGQRATPYEAMAEFSERMAGVLSVDEVLPRMAESAATGVGASRARVRLFLPEGRELRATWPPDSSTGQMNVLLPVSYQGQDLGEIAIAKPAGEPLLPAERKLLVDLAAQTGLVMRNVRLTRELQQRLEEISSQAAAIRQSRQRIIAAQSTERRRLEQTIREGAETQLVSIKAELRRAEQIVVTDRGSAAALLEELTSRANGILENLRDLARGIYPPLLSERGIVAALQAQVEKMQVRAQIRATSLDRYSPEAETAVYFACVEALRAATGPATIDMSAKDGAVEFRVEASSLDLNGESQEIDDRIQALGGSVVIGRASMSGWVPVRAREPVV